MGHLAFRPHPLIAGNAPSPALVDGAAELLGEINLAIDKTYRARKRKLTLDELGRIAAPRHAAILAACRRRKEFPHALAIMVLRLEEELDGEEAAEKG